MTSPAIRIDVLGDPVSAAVRIVHFGGHPSVRKMPAAEAWERSIAIAALEAMDGRPQMTGPVMVEALCLFRMPISMHRKRTPTPSGPKTTKPDVDKVARCILDSLEGVVYGHDAQVAELRILKLWAPQGKPGMAEIVVSEIGGAA